jgi:hypothetical protein
LGLDPEKGGWDAIIDGEWVGESQGVSVSPNGALTVNGATRNVILFYWGFPGSFGENTNGFDQPFLNQHSVIIATTFVVVTIIVLAVVVRARRKELN